MKKNEFEEETTSELNPADLKLDHIDHRPSHLIQEDTAMDDVIRKASRLAKLSLLLTILGVGGLGYLHFSDKAAIDDAIARSKATMKQEILGDMKEGMATAQQLQALVEKNAELEIKIDSYAGQISNLEMKNEQLQVELEKNASLRSKMAELQASMKKAVKAPAKPVAKNIKAKKNSKSPASKKPAKKNHR